MTLSSLGEVLLSGPFATLSNVTQDKILTDAWEDGGLSVDSSRGVTIKSYLADSHFCYPDLRRCPPDLKQDDEEMTMKAWGEVTKDTLLDTIVTVPAFFKSCGEGTVLIGIDDDRKTLIYLRSVGLKPRCLDISGLSIGRLDVCPLDWIDEGDYCVEAKNSNNHYPCQLRLQKQFGEPSAETINMRIRQAANCYWNFPA